MLMLLLLLMLSLMLLLMFLSLLLFVDFFVIVVVVLSLLSSLLFVVVGGVTVVMVILPSLTLCLVDGMQRSEDAENTKNVDRDGIRLKIKRQETDAGKETVEHVEARSHEGAALWFKTR